MIDLDGDGLQDHVLRIPGYKTYWKRNKSGTYGQLCKINLPQGGNVQIEYEGKYGTITEAAGHMNHSVITEYEYSDGFYDRDEYEKRNK